jgi:phosphatidylinositol alpha-1,6-mannosyltransferase
MVGLPTGQAELVSLAQQLHVSQYVHFLGRVGSDALLKCLNVCDVFVMTSRHTSSGDFEGYGIAVVEAALCGKPAVVSSNSGLAEAIVDGQTGLLVPEGNPDATADAIISLLANTYRRRAMGEKARKRALDEQTWDKRGDIYDRFLRRVLSTYTMVPPALPPRASGDGVC